MCYYTSTILLQVKNIEGKGRGVFATQYFQENSFVVEYAGELRKRKELEIVHEMLDKANIQENYDFHFTHNNNSYL